MKYYAVKRGRTPGIFETWAACREQIDHYSGAAYKAFESRQEAEAFLQEAEQLPIKEGLPVAYIDGSFSKSRACYGWGGFIECAGQRHILQGTGNTPQYLSERNIAGELIGALQVSFKCMNLGITEINLFYDYAGIENYITRSWNARTPLARYYRDTADLTGDSVKVNYIYVRGHTGIEGNEIADLLAKEAVGARLRRKDAATLDTFRRNNNLPLQE